MEVDSVRIGLCAPRRGAVPLALALALGLALPAVLAGAVRRVVLLHERSGVLAPLAAGAAMVVLLVAVLLAVVLGCEPVARPSAWLLTLAAVLLPAGSATRPAAALDGSDQRVLHDRGIVVRGVVSAHRDIGGGGGAVDPPATFLATVRTDDGSLLSVETARAGRPWAPRSA
ncbi:hypothetical protein [Kitasatospora sp. NPDC091207]|uniref:hypothetical protein n=1 Tax=Kitasatospora sp. NPDC091207 TaxID=3364083 RepID=UPI0037F21CF4